MKLRTFLAAATALLAAGCADGTIPTSSPVTPPEAPSAYTTPSSLSVTCYGSSTGSNQIQVGLTGLCVATGRDAWGQQYFLAEDPTWNSSSPSTISVDAGGNVTAHQAGWAQISATLDGVTGSVWLEAYGSGSQTLTRVSVSPSSATLSIGDNTTLSATAYDQNDDPMSASFTWSTSDSSVATVSPSGVVTAVGAGSATITVTAGGESATVTITVQSPIVYPGNEICTQNGQQMLCPM